MVRRRNVGFFYGSLASGADILFVEAGLTANRDAHVVLPFKREDFVRVSVADSGDGWVDRFDRCLNHEKVKTSYVTEDAFQNQNLIFSHAAQRAMGLAVLQARHLDADLRQIAVWNGEDTGGDAGTAADVRFWRELGQPTDVIGPPSGMRPEADVPPAPETSQNTVYRLRELKALVFADVKGFSKLDDAMFPDFVEVVLDPISGVMDRQGDSLEFRNIWGDGLFSVFSDVERAACCALEMQSALSVIDYAHHNLPSGLALRIGCHFGPVFVMEDPITNRLGYFGGHVNKAARIEPVTPPGEVYVSEAFAAHLALVCDELDCEYVGDVASAKGYGSFRMYLLREA